MRYLLLGLLFVINVLEANPAPLGIELNVTTFEEVLNKYPTAKVTKDPLGDKAKALEIDLSCLGMDNLLYALFSFREDGVVDYMNIHMDPLMFEHMIERLKKDYIREGNPTSTKAFAFRNNDWSLLIAANKLDNILDLCYYADTYLERKSDIKEARKNQKKESLSKHGF